MHEHEARLEARLEQKAAAPVRLKTGVLALTGVLRTPTARSGDVAVRIENLVSGYPGKPVVRAERLEARRGSRIGLVGPNGAGKTTLLRTVAGELAPIDGWLELGHGVQIGYLAQIRKAPMPGTTVLESLTNGGGMDQGPARSYLARFLFRGEDVMKPVDQLSGGERSRLELALVGLQAANLLLLDEPTNHLDIGAREALETFLRDAPGTVIVVSHDRRMLEAVCTELWVVEDAGTNALSRVARFAGGFNEWRAAVADGWTVSNALDRAAPPAPAAAVARDTERVATPASNGKHRQAAKPAGRAPRQVLSKDAYRRRRQVVEDDLTRLGVRKSQLELALGDPKVQSNFVELRRVTSELADVNAALAQAEDAWLVLAEQAPR
jgi:ATP-binding cassette subfamily F protein 3